MNIKTKRKPYIHICLPIEMTDMFNKLKSALEEEHKVTYSKAQIVTMSLAELSKTYKFK